MAGDVGLRDTTCLSAASNKTRCTCAGCPGPEQAQVKVFSHPTTKLSSVLAQFLDVCVGCVVSHIKKLKVNTNAHMEHHINKIPVAHMHLC